MNNLARIILSADIKTSINSMMSNLKWLKLDQRWNNMILVILFKCITGNAPDYLCSKISLILFMIIVQEAIPQISLLFLIVRVTQVLEHFMKEQLIFGTIQLIAIHSLTLIQCHLVNLSALYRVIDLYFFCNK